jgi:hypothetical protein
VIEITQTSIFPPYFQKQIWREGSKSKMTLPADALGQKNKRRIRAGVYLLLSSQKCLSTAL